MRDTILDFGQTVVALIIGLAEFLVKDEGAPGLVATCLILALFILSALYFRRSRRQISAIRSFQNALKKYKGIPDFAEGFEGFKHQVTKLKGDKEGTPRHELWQAWDEYAETIVPDTLDGEYRMRNSIRPSSFLNIQDLGFGPGLYRLWPTTFVSVGLLLTFLGLVAALADFSSSMDTPGASGSMNDAMTSFMSIASAKFVMSLVGLACSVLFGFVLRKYSDKVDRDLHELCLLIERRLVFVSLEDIGFRQLKAAEEQREHLRTIGLEMVAELRQPLDALPDKITTSISEQMDPILDKVSSMGTSSMESMVGDLSSQLSHTVSHALTRASESLGEAADRIGQMVDRMNGSNAQASEGLETALSQLSQSLASLREDVAATGSAASSAMSEGAEKMLGVMNDTLAGIRDNTSEGASAMRQAAEEMRKAAESFGEQISSAAADGASAVETRMAETGSRAEAAIGAAGQALMGSFDSASREIAELGSRMGETVGNELLGRLEALGLSLDEMVAAIESGASGAKQAATNLADGARSISGATTSFDQASSTLVAAATPLQSGQERIESALRRLGDQVDTTTSTLTQAASLMTDRSATVLETAQTALGSEREGIRASLEGIRAAMERLAGEAERLDQIDEMLGRALTSYGDQLEQAMGSAQDHIAEMSKTLSPALDTMRQVVEQAEAFMPAQRRRA